MKKPKLLALDLDGTLFSSDSVVSEKNKAAVKAARREGVEVTISTGRPFIGLPLSFMEEADIRYAITTNGSALYRFPEKQCLYSQCMDPEKTAALLDILVKKHMHFDVFIEGDGFSDIRLRPVIDELEMAQPLRNYIKKTRRVVEDIGAFVREKGLPVQKITMNFPGDEGNEVRQEVYDLLTADPYFRTVSGGYNNLELTRADVSKANALKFLCEHLGISVSESMAIGDTENDLDILVASGTGVAMGNSPENIKAAADLVTLTNDEDGVAAVIFDFLNQD